MEGRFTRRPSRDSHGGRQSSAGTAAFCPALRTGGKGSFRRRHHAADRTPRRSAPTAGRRATYGRTGARKRHGDPMRTFAFRRCAPGPRPSASATTSCGRAARSPVAHGPLGLWRERPPSPRAWYGFGRRCVFTLLPPPPGSLPHHQSLREGQSNAAADQQILLRLAPFSSPRANAESLAPATHGDLGLDTAIRACHYATPSVRVSPPVQGDRRRFEAASHPPADRPLAETSGHRGEGRQRRHGRAARLLKSGCARRERPLAFLQRTD